MSFDPVAQTAITLIERWGPSPIAPDGEDTSGKQKMRVLTPEETAQRAVETAMAVYVLLMEHGLIVELAPHGHL